eukprot:CAMPEP_0206213578 /NCGR_PEP_ID=MMETSP0047_2-20121206/1199_1 /ASSEMBLY_ACC=CAM_ASM_000192 /TAXON_ID=195065 /ORGANISM="Chroomonas mesostigmatica_cf, Strain CCMP1168" /LENGTH=121 /DNA_ID=CAMNT_0053635741 /DNA_START=502 /DNA_END=864 /DNA_ORIENTATION=+
MFPPSPGRLPLWKTTCLLGSPLSSSSFLCGRSACQYVEDPGSSPCALPWAVACQSILSLLGSSSAKGISLPEIQRIHFRPAPGCSSPPRGGARPGCVQRARQRSRAALRSAGGVLSEDGRA